MAASAAGMTSIAWLKQSATTQEQVQNAGRIMKGIDGIGGLPATFHSGAYLCEHWHE